MTQAKFERKKYIDEFGGIQGWSCDQPFDPETYTDDNDMPSNRSVDSGRDLDKTHLNRAVDPDRGREDDYDFLERHTGTYILCRGMNWI